MEEPLPAGGSCLLGSINLSEFVKNKVFDYADFTLAVKKAVRGLNAVLDEGLPLHPLEEQQRNVAHWRQIGLGIFGLADMLIKMELPYDSNEAIEFSKKIARIMKNSAVSASIALAKEKGAFPGFKKEVFAAGEFASDLTIENELNLARYGIRNSQLLTIAPTGTLSTMLGVSGGIEPIFDVVYRRKTQSLHGEDVFYDVYTPIVKEYMEAHNIKSIDKLPPLFVCAKEIDYHNRIKMQSTWQQFIDASISSTVNLPNEASPEDIYNLYLYAWEKNCKGITVYREGCAREGVLTGEEKKKEAPAESSRPLGRGDIIKVDDDLLSMKRTVHTGCGKFYLHLDFDEMTGEPMETWIEPGKNGGCKSNLHFISRLISLCLRGGIPLEAVIDQSRSVSECHAFLSRRDRKGDTSPGTCCASAIGWALAEINKKITERCFEDIPSEEELDKKEVEKALEKFVLKQNAKNGTTCPECGNELERSGGCITCPVCGWSKCN